MGRVWLEINRFETMKGVWTVVRVEGDSYSLRNQVKAYGKFRYGFPFDVFVACKQESGLEGEEFRKWLDANADKRDKRWSTHFAGAPNMNSEKIYDLAVGIGQACGLPQFDIREGEPVILGTVGADPGNGVGLGDEDVAPAGPEEDGADLPF